MGGGRSKKTKKAKGLEWPKQKKKAPKQRKSKIVRDHFCIECNRRFDLSGMRKHNKGPHRNRKKYECNICLNRHKNRYRLISHRAKGHYKTFPLEMYKMRNLPLPNPAGKVNGAKEGEGEEEEEEEEDEEEEEELNQEESEVDENYEADYEDEGEEDEDEEESEDEEADEDEELQQEDENVLLEAEDDEAEH